MIDFLGWSRLDVGYIILTSFSLSNISSSSTVFSLPLLPDLPYSYIVFTAYEDPPLLFETVPESFLSGGLVLTLFWGVIINSKLRPKSVLFPR